MQEQISGPFNWSKTPNYNLLNWLSSKRHSWNGTRKRELKRIDEASFWRIRVNLIPSLKVIFKSEGIYTSFLHCVLSETFVALAVQWLALKNGIGFSPPFFLLLLPQKPFCPKFHPVWSPFPTLGFASFQVPMVFDNGSCKILSIWK